MPAFARTVSAIPARRFRHADRATDNQLSIITRHAEPLLPADRDKYLHRVASLLHDVEIGDGTVARACAQAQREFFKGA